jgi:hypothetical protein
VKILLWERKGRSPFLEANAEVLLEATNLPLEADSNPLAPFVKRHASEAASAACPHGRRPHGFVLLLLLLSMVVVVLLHLLLLLLQVMVLLLLLLLLHLLLLLQLLMMVVVVVLLLLR